jgi:uncharacterized protein (DUF302 family)/uncharacterized membrane protein YidH (DUF202 family)
MTDASQSQSQARATDYLAVERTFLAWIRTGVALMGLGFVLARFGLFLQEFNINQPDVKLAHYGLSLWFGTSLIFLGVFAAVFSLIRYLRLMSQLKKGQDSFSKPSTLGIVVAVLLAALGLAMSLYLVLTRPASQPNNSKSQENSMSTTPENGIVRLPSSHSVPETVAQLQEILRNKGVKVFTIVDHSGEAEKAGLKMPDTKLLIFGNPKGGTPLMLAAPSVALDLPLKILVAEDTTGKTWISYNAPAYLQTRHNLPADLVPNIAVIDALAANAAK